MSSLLRNTRNRADYKLVGVYLPPSLYNKLTVYALANKLSKSEVLLQRIDIMLEDYYEEDSCLYNIVERYQDAWIALKQEKPRAKYPDFLYRVEKELGSKGLTSKQYRFILKKLRYENYTP